MGKFRDRLARFMAGRYGMDSLYNALLAVIFVLIVVNLFVKTPILTVALWLVMLLAVLRTFSKNIERRKRENEAFMKWWKPIRSKFRLTVRRVKEIKTHRFRTCPNCKAVIRLPRKKGTRTIVCPTCKTEFETHISF